jgi:hypothetical protein
MTDMDPNQVEIDSLLRRSMVAPVPALSPDFDQRVLRSTREPRRNPQALGRYSRILVTGYGITSVVASTVVMRGQGLNWGAISLLILGPLTLVAAANWARRATHATMRPSTK